MINAIYELLFKNQAPFFGLQKCGGGLAPVALKNADQPADGTRNDQDADGEISRFLNFLM
jgi:hypothetical protein